MSAYRMARPTLANTLTTSASSKLRTAPRRAYGVRRAVTAAAPSSQRKLLKIDGTRVYSLPSFADAIAHSARVILESSRGRRSLSARAFIAQDAYLRVHEHLEVRPPDAGYAAMAMAAVQAVWEIGGTIVLPLDWVDVTYRIQRGSGEHGLQQVQALIQFVRILYPQAIVQESG